MDSWLIGLLVAGSIVSLVILQAWSEKRRALRHMRGRPSLTDVEFGRQFFTSDRQEIASRLRQILSRHIAVDVSQLHPGDKLVRDIRMDSLDSLSTVEFVFDVEREFGISIPNTAAEQMYTLQDVVEYVASHSPKPMV
jgi:acyl carrier protein